MGTPHDLQTKGPRNRRRSDETLAKERSKSDEGLREERSATDASLRIKQMQRRIRIAQVALACSSAGVRT